MSILNLVVFSVALGFTFLSPEIEAAAPAPESVKAEYLSSEAELLDRHGESIQQLRIDMTVRRLPWVALTDISPALIEAVIQAEDRHFRTHQGVDVMALGKAAWDNLFRDHPRGASTISMQLASMLDKRLRARQGRRDLGQKWDQIAAARELEGSWSKNQILEAYLNLVTFRGELQGIGAASQQLYGKAASGLDDVESMLLASLIRAPNASPKLVARRACALATERKMTVVCGGMEQRLKTALARSAASIERPLAAPLAQRLLKHPAERILSTIDGDLQRVATGSLRQQLSLLQNRNVRDGAIVVLDNRSGDILAYVGNAGDSSVDGVRALRQAGSTLKPFLYELAIEKKLLTAASILDDSAIDISTPAGLYVPQNYDKDFKGYVSLRTSLAGSLNVPAVRTLLLVGLEAFYERLKSLGLTSLTRSADYYGYSLSLGSAEVSLLELTNAYRTLANNGMAATVRLTARADTTQWRVLDQRSSFIVSDILSDRAARSITFGLSNELATPFWSAVKTGTSKDLRDNWCIGYSEKFTVGVWVGNFDGESMWDVSGVTGAAPVWRDVMDFLHKDTTSHAAAVPRNVFGRQIEYIPAVETSRHEWFLSGTESTKIELVAASRRPPKILYPSNGSILAIDPDIPQINHRIFFHAQSGAKLYWNLDEVNIGEAGEDFSWYPVPGQHHLKLVDNAGTKIDAIRFQVRGNYPSPVGDLKR